MAEANLTEMNSVINKAKERRMSSIDMGTTAVTFQSLVSKSKIKRQSSVEVSTVAATFQSLIDKSNIKRCFSVEGNTATTPAVNPFQQPISRSTSTENISSKTNKNSNPRLNTKVMSAVFVNAAAVAFNNLISKRKNDPVPLSFIAQAAQRASDSLTKQFGNSRRKQRIVENYCLVWLHPNLGENDENYQQSRLHLQRFINAITLFTDPEQCIGYLSQINDEKIFIIVSDLIESSCISRIHDIVQVDSMYILCQGGSTTRPSITGWSKVRNICTDISSLGGLLEEAARQSDQDSVLLSFVPPNSLGLDQNFDRKFLCTQLMRKILLETDTTDEKSMDALATYCHTFYITNHAQLKNILRFSREYRLHSPLWWYKNEGFLSSMLNRAFRNLEMDTILKMSFVIRDIHHDIEQTYLEQPTQRLIVYRGQGLSRSVFEQLAQMKGGLLSFNNFLSASTGKASPMKIALHAAEDPQSIGVVFLITIDSSIPFAKLYRESENEVLLSISTVFYIGDIKTIDDNPQLWQVKLSIATEEDPQLGSVMDAMDKLIGGTRGWYRLGELLNKIDELQKSEQVYTAMIDQTSDDNEKAHLYQQIGHLYKDRGSSIQTISFYEKALVIRQRTLPSNHPDLIFSLRDIGEVYDGLGEYCKSVWYYEKAFEIEREILPATHPSLATACNKIGTICSKISEYSKALEFYENALHIRQSAVPLNWKDMVVSFESIGSLHRTLGDYSKALSFYERAVDIHEKHLPQDHPDLAKLYSNVGMVHIRMNRYLRALSFHKQALAINQKTLSQKSSSLAASYAAIASVYYNLDQESEALMFYERAMSIYEQVLPPQHHLFVELYDSIGAVYDKMDQYLRAIEFYEKSLKLRQEILPPNHPELAQCMSNIGSVYYDVGDFVTALSLHERAVEIGQSTLSPTHPDLDFYRKCVQATKRRLVSLEQTDE